ncbi:MAG: HNH endonuclease [Desulfitobacteriaceae bacterium]
MPKQDKGSKLCSEWRLDVRQFRYSEWGNWYGLIKSYPAALLDPNGYLYLESPAALNILGIKIGKRINVPNCISSLPGYIRIKQDNNIPSQNDTNMNMADVKYHDEPLVTKSQWKDILQNNGIAHELDIKTVLVVFNSPQNRTTATDIAEILDESDFHIISSRNTSFSRRICKYLNIKPPKNSNGGNRWWTIPYLGSPKGDGKYYYILRPELKEAIEELISEGRIYNSVQDRHTITEAIFDREVLEKEFDHAIEESKKLTKEARMNRILNADRNLVQIRVAQTIFKRNHDVVVEVLERAAGICEACKNPAPFIRKNDNSPYLEVHHIKALSDGGEDTIENTVAVCPNCHRKYHYGKINSE